MKRSLKALVSVVMASSLLMGVSIPVANAGDKQSYSFGHCVSQAQNQSERTACHWPHQVDVHGR